MIPEYLIIKTKKLVADQLGWDFGNTRSRDFDRGLHAMAIDLGIKDNPEAVTSWLQAMKWTPSDLDTLTKYLTVGETYFFREMAQLDLFRQRIIPELLAERAGKDQRLKIWSAGCCTGEEPYTIAMLLHQIVPQHQQWNIEIIGTDINTIFLDKARRGIYSTWSFRETPKDIQNRYFRKAGTAAWEVIPEIKNMVTFSLLNLAENNFPSISGNIIDIDVLFCRNVLMYFTSNQISAVSHRFYRTLNPRGWFIPSAVELNDQIFSDFAPVSHDNCIVYRKVEKKVRSIAHIEPSLPRQFLPVERPAQKIKPIYKPTQAPVLHYPKKEQIALHPLQGAKAVQHLYGDGHYQQCIEQCITIHGENPEIPGIVSLIVKSYANLGMLDLAQKWGEKMLLLSSSVANDYYLVATIMIEMGNLERAESILKRSLYLDPHHLLSQYLMGTVSMKLNKDNTSKKHFRNVAELLSAFDDGEIISGADGLTAGRLRELVAALK